MTTDILIVFSIIGVASVFFASGRIRLDITALLVVLALMLSGILTVRESLAGFGDPVVILVAGLLVVGEMIHRTGISHAIGRWIARKGGKSEIQLVLLLMAAAAVMGSLMSSTAVVAIFIPVALSICNKSGLSASRLLMPLSYGALVSGMLTLIATTPNLVISSELETSGFGKLSFFSFSPIGLAILIVAMLYMAFVGRHLLPGSKDTAQDTGARTMRELAAGFAVSDRAIRLQIPSESSLVGQSLGQAQIGTLFSVHVLILERQEIFNPSVRPLPRADTRLKGGDVLVVLAENTDIDALVSTHNLVQLPVEDRHRQLWFRHVGLATVLVHPESRLTGKTIVDAHFRSKYGLQVVAIRRNQVQVEDYLDEPLKSGDALLILGPWSKIQQLQTASHDFVVLSLPSELTEAAPAHDKAPIAMGILAGMVLLSVVDVIPLVATVLLASLAAVVTGCLTMSDGYRAIHWSSIVLIAGMFPIADALQKTGGVDLIVQGLVSGVGDAGPYVMMSALFFTTAGLGLFLSNTATAVLMAPIAIRTAGAMDVSPYTFAIVVLIAASSAFATPVSSPVVTLVVEPGRYRFWDFVKTGLPLMVLTWGTTLLVTPLLFPL